MWLLDYSTSRRYWAQNMRIKGVCVSNTHASASLTRAESKFMSIYELAYCSYFVVSFDGCLWYSVYVFKALAIQLLHQ